MKFIEAVTLGPRIPLKSASRLIEIRKKKMTMTCRYFLALSAVATATAFSPTLTLSNTNSKSLVNLYSTRDDNEQQGSSWTRREIFETGAKTLTVATAGASSSSGLWLPPSTANAADAPTTTAVPTVRLGKSDLEVSRTIQGYWQLAGGHGRYKESDAIQNMQAHFDAGVTTLDTADIYGPSELIVGKFVKSQPKAIPCTKFCCFRYLEVSTSIIFISMVFHDSGINQ